MNDPLKTEYLPLAGLKGNASNPKQHDVELIDSSISRFGIVDRITVDGRTGTLISGHGRTRALTEMHARGDVAPTGVQVAEDGSWLVPVNTGWASRDDLEATAALIAMNRTTEVGGWVDDSLLQLLDTISGSEYGLEGVGFTEIDVDDMHTLMNSLDEEAALAADKRDKKDEPKEDKPDLDEEGANALGSGGSAVVKIILTDAGLIDAWHTLRDIHKNDDEAARVLFGMVAPKKVRAPKAKRSPDVVEADLVDDYEDDEIGIDLESFNPEGTS